MKIVKYSCAGKEKVRTCTFSPQVNIKNKREPIQTQEDVNAAHNQSKMQDLAEDLKTVIWAKVKDVATSETFGWDDDNVGDDFFVNVTPTEIGEDHQEAVRIEVRAEVDYEGLEELMEALNPIVESYDSYAYFEPVTSGIIEAYVSVDQVDMSVYGSTSDEYTNRFVYQYHGKSFSVYSNDISLMDARSVRFVDDIYYLWKANVSQQSGAYNAADEDYVYAFIRGQGTVEYYKHNGNYVATSTYNLRDDDDFEEAWEYMQIILDDVCDHLIEYNKDVPDRMVHNSTNVGASDDHVFIEDIIDKLEEAGYDISDIEDIKVGLERYLGYDEETADDIIKDLIKGQFISVNPLVSDIYSGTTDFKTSENYKGRRIKLLNDGTGYAIFEKGEMIDYGFKSLEDAEAAIDEYDDVYVESSDYESDSGIFIEDIIDSLEDNGYDLSRIRSIRRGLLELFGYKGKDADIIIHDLVAGRFIDPNDWIDKDYTPGVYSATEEDEEDLPMVDQEYDSAATSINSSKLPAIYKMINLEPGGLYVDFGGGRWDNAVEYIKDKGATLVVYDPYNRSAEHNKEVLRILRENGGADAAVNSNVLNVIKEPEARKNVLENIARITKPGAPIYITVYEGKGDGQEGPTKSGYQLNRKTADYLEEIQEVFPDATRRGKLIIAHNSSSVTSSWYDPEIIDRSDKDVVDYQLIARKQIDDNDGFSTDYAVYVVYLDDGSVEYECYHGDRDFYGPWNGEGLDFESENDDEAVEWYNSYGSDDVLESTTDVEASAEEFFTKEDLIEFAINVEDEINKRINPGKRKQFTVADAYIENRNLYIELSNSDYDLSANCTLDMRTIRRPSDLHKYVGTIVNSMIEQYNEFKGNDIIDSSTEVVGDAFSDLEDDYLTPPEYDEPIQHEDSEEVVEVELNQIITVDVDGDYEWDDDTYVWASPDNSNDDWRSEDGVFLDDKVGVVEHIDDLIIPNVPTRPGKYRVTGSAKLVYDVSGIQEYRTEYGPDDYDSDIDIDHAVVSFNFRKSEVQNLKVTPVRR